MKLFEEATNHVDLVGLNYYCAQYEQLVVWALEVRVSGEICDFFLLVVIAIHCLQVVPPGDSIDSIPRRHSAVDWRETASDGLTRCARLVRALVGSIGQSLAGC